MAQVNKSTIRDNILNWRENKLDQELWDVKSHEICQTLVEITKNQDPETVMGYITMNREVKLSDFYRGGFTEVRFAIPAVRGDELILYGGIDAEDLVGSIEADSIPNGFIEGEYGIPEPDPSEFETITSDDLDIVLVPGLAFDKKGNRVGYGAGYYDRFLSSLKSRVITLGVCFREQFFKDTIATESHDVPVDRVVTDDGVH